MWVFSKDVTGAHTFHSKGVVDSALGPVLTSKELGSRIVHEVKMGAGGPTKQHGSSDEGGLGVLQAQH